MKYYLIEIAEGDSKIAGKGMYEYDNREMAIANFHSKMGVAMKSDLYTREQLLVIDDGNSIIKSEIFIREVKVDDTPIEETE